MSMVSAPQGADAAAPRELNQRGNLTSSSLFDSVAETTATQALPPPGLETDADMSKNPQPIPQLPISTSPTIPPPLAFLASPLYTLHIGGNLSSSSHQEPAPITTFHVHSVLLTSLSPFFRAAFSNRNNFSESSTHSMRLSEELVEDWTYFLQWVHVKGALAMMALSNTMLNALYHPQIDEPLVRFRAYLSEKKTVAAAARHGDISQLIMDRPRPPAFGPLVRLYLLADRFDIGGGLRGEIGRRVRSVALLYDDDGNGNESRKLKQRHPRFVPTSQDVNRLWRGMGDEDPHCVSKDGEGEGLKSVVLDIFAVMKGRGMFANVHENGGGKEYDPEFLRDLVVRLLDRRVW